MVQKTDLISRLRKEILPLEGLRAAYRGDGPEFGWGEIQEAFPLGIFPLGAVHEFITTGPETTAATSGFISGILGCLMKKGGAVVWVGKSLKIFPPALKQFGIDPGRVIFISLQKEKDLLWALEESLKCNGLSAVVGEISDFSFTHSRRFQLAVEQSQVTGFIIRNHIGQININTCVSRWEIQPVPSETFDGLPGLGFSRWQVELLKIRNGKPGTWLLDWAADRFQLITQKMPAIHFLPKKKTG